MLVLLSSVALVLYATACYISSMTDLLNVAFGCLDLSGHSVGHASAAEDHGTDQAGQDATGKWGGHQPEGPAQVEGVLAVGSGA